MKKQVFKSARICGGMIIKLAALLTAFAVFAFNHGGLMSELRAAPEAYYAESEASLYERLNGCFEPESFSVAAMDTGGDKLGSAVSFRLFGKIALKSVPVIISERPLLIPGGEPVGLSIYTEGVLIVGISGFTDSGGKSVSPAKEAGICAGDVIFGVNGSPVATSLELQDKIDSSQGGVTIEAERDGERFSAEITPRRDAEGRLRIGAWVRDSTVGVGTLSFCDPGSGLIAALGHAVTDADTGTLVKVAGGKLVLATLLGVTKGRQGAPGELRGTFNDSSPFLGSIFSNTELGVFGKAADPFVLEYAGTVPVAFPDEVHTGPAVILSAASGTVREYSCRIVKTGRQNAPAPKGLVIEIDDEALLQLTGGIVQGMSGSPILQDGKLAGAVTHVFVNDPQKGFGAYAYWMYKVSKGEIR